MTASESITHARALLVGAQLSALANMLATADACDDYRTRPEWSTVAPLIRQAWDLAAACDPTPFPLTDVESIATALCDCEYLDAYLLPVVWLFLVEHTTEQHAYHLLSDAMAYRNRGDGWEHPSMRDLMIARWTLYPEDVDELIASVAGMPSPHLYS